MVEVFDTHQCTLGEGPLWHPKRQELFWFDIEAMQLRSAVQVWQFSEHVSAAGWIDRDTLMIASASALFQFDLLTGIRTDIIELEADDPVTRSNDGRADPWGGFWIGTMGKNAEPGAGAIYRFYRGELQQLYPNITISNAICFAPDQSCAYWCDTPTKQIMRQPLAANDGWPVGEPEVCIDLSETDYSPDGALTDSEGTIWNAQWSNHRVAAYAPDGTFLRALELPAAQVTCPAFGGPEFRTMFATSAAIGLSGVDDGKTFAATDLTTGRPEPRVIL